MIRLTPTKNSWFPGERLSNKQGYKKLSFFSAAIIISEVIIILAIAYLCRIETIIASPLIPKNSLSNISGKNLLLLNEHKEAAFILNRSPELQAVTVRKSYPNSVVITAQKARPLVQIPNNHSFLIVSEFGRIMKTETLTTESLITVEYFQHLRSFETKPGTMLTALEIQKSIEIVRLRSRLPFPLEKITIAQPGKLLVTFKEKPLTVTLGTEKDIAKILFILHNIIKGLERKGVKPSSINLEFDKPIITV